MNHLKHLSQKIFKNFTICTLFISNDRLKLAQNQANAKQYLEPKLWLTGIIPILYPYYPPKMCACINEVKRLTIMKMKMKMKCRPHRYAMN